MRGLPALPADASHRTRRWDAVILGGALPGLAAGVVLAKRGARILVVEEEAATRRFEGLREPFVTPNADRGGVLGTCLAALGIPMIDRQAFAGADLAYQVVFPDARLDVGTAATSADELVAWGFAKPDTARELVDALATASAVEREALLEAPLVRAPRIRDRARRRTPGPARSEHRGLPPQAVNAAPRVRALLDAQVRALSQGGSAEPSPEAKARILGWALEGATDAPPGLRSLLRKRLESLHGEFRGLDEGFALVNSAGRAGLALSESGEIWAGRLLLINAPRSALAEALDADEVPDALRCAAPRTRRVSLHLRIARARLPEGMARRVILPEGDRVVTVRVFPPARGASDADLVASTLAPAAADPSPAEDAIERALASLMPLSRGHLERQPQPPVRWDTDDLLGDPPPGGGWPTESELRIGSRPSIYALDRSGVGGLGCEGDLLLGWRGGEAIAADLG